MPKNQHRLHVINNYICKLWVRIPLEAAAGTPAAGLRQRRPQKLLKNFTNGCKNSGNLTKSPWYPILFKSSKGPDSIRIRDSDSDFAGQGAVILEPPSIWIWFGFHLDSKMCPHGDPISAGALPIESQRLKAYSNLQHLCQEVPRSAYNAILEDFGSILDSFRESCERS